MNRLQKKYNEEIKLNIAKEFSLTSMQVPRLVKVTMNMGLGREATANSGVVEKAQEQLTTIAGQKAMETKAKKAISSFKLRAGQSIGVMVTLRGDRMYSFVDRFISVVLPRERDFQGVPSNSFDKQGNYSLGINEQALFPEIDITKIDKVRGMQVTFTIKAVNKDHSYALLKAMGMPFKTEEL